VFAGAGYGPFVPLVSTGTQWVTAKKTLRQVVINAAGVFTPDEMITNHQPLCEGAFAVSICCFLQNQQDMMPVQLGIMRSVSVPYPVGEVIVKKHVRRETIWKTNRVN